MTTGENTPRDLSGRWETRRRTGRFGRWCARRGIHPGGLSVSTTLAVFVVTLAAVAAYALTPVVVATGIVLVLAGVAVIAALVGPLIVTGLRHRRAAGGRG